MKRFLSIAMVSTFVLFSAHANTNKGTRIVGGELVDPAITKTNYIVSIGGGCAGSIISSKWILTAAHCQSIFGRAITGGSVDLKDSNRVRLTIKNSYIHPENDGSKYRYDFALLELSDAIDFEATGLGSIGLVNPDLMQAGSIDAGVIATVLGWGTTRESGSVSPLLRKVDVPIVSHEVANAKTSYNGQVDDTMLPAGYLEGKKDSCQGDSGGPLTIEGSDGSPILAGVVSWGKGCARANYYGVYGNVAMAYPWIMEQTNNLQ